MNFLRTDKIITTPSPNFPPLLSNITEAYQFGSGNMITLRKTHICEENENV